MIISDPPCRQVVAVSLTGFPPSTSSLEPNTPLNSWNFSSSSSNTRRSAALFLFRKFTTTTS